MTILTKPFLFELGLERITKFCDLNNLELPEVSKIPLREWSFEACAYYRPTYIKICLEKCANPGHAGRSWSWPGYTVDRTPFGVLAHELGHHVDYHRSSRRGSYHGNYSEDLRTATREDQLTTYCPNSAEWFAEHFRLFVTNPDLLRLLRPRTYAKLHKTLKPVVDMPWYAVLEDAPPRTIAATRHKIEREGHAQDR